MEKFNEAVILAGGKSSRMGFDKQWLEIDRKRLINSLVEDLKVEFRQIIIVTNTPHNYTDMDCVTVCDEIKDCGPLSGMHAGLKKATGEYVYFLACDMPVINQDYIRFMKEKIQNIKADACITRYGDYIEPFNAFYSRNIVKAVENHLLRGHKSIFSLLDTLNCVYIEEQVARQFSPDWGMFLNLNTMDDLTKYLHSVKVS